MLDKQVKLVNKYLRDFFDLKLYEAKKISPFSYEITESLANYSLRGGKRIRALFFILGYKAFKGKITDEIVKSSICMELIQSSLLIHDDIIDQDELRRGEQTIHKEYSQYKSLNDDHFGKSIAIIIGDLAINFAYELISNSNFRAESILEAVKVISHYTNLVNYGQSMDTILAYKKIYSKRDIDLVYYYKSMTYTTEMPLLLGATLAGVNKKNLGYLMQYAKYSGIAFQIQDDIMGVFGDEVKLGKPIGSDISENKKTILILKAYEKASNKDKKILNDLLGKEGLDQKEIGSVREIIRKTGSLKYARDLSLDLTQKAIKSISMAKIDIGVKKELIDIARYIVNRDK